MGKLGEVLSHPDEILPLARMYIASKNACKLPSDPKLAFCYDVLNSVSRSFAVVIQQLPNPLRDAVCVFYLVLRGLDTVEDDMAIPLAKKVPDLLAFHEHIYRRGFTMDCGYGEYVRLMREFDTVVDVFLGLDSKFQAVIADITRRMGAGMAKFIAKNEVDTVAEYDEYCHFVAGLVGIGLSQMFASSGLESTYFLKHEELSNDMGLFLQKVNITRDYLEDIDEEPVSRMWWPREIWGRYAASLDAFKDPANRVEAVRCLNHMVLEAMRHLPACIEYMQRLHHPDVFRFCAIPQIMSMGTFAICYNNGAVFEGPVKMRRGLTARVFDELRSMGDLYRWYLLFLHQLADKAAHEVDPADPNVKAMQSELAAYIAMCEEGLSKEDGASSSTAGERATNVMLLIAAGAFFYRVWGMGSDVGAGTLLGSGPLLSASTAGLEQYFALVLLLGCLMRVVIVRQ